MMSADITTSYRLLDAPVDRTRGRAVCFKCAYVTVASDASTCAVCGSLLIKAPAAANDADDDELCPDIVAIFDRTSVSVGAPPLPGLDPRPRKAQLMAEARRKRVERARVSDKMPAIDIDLRPRRWRGLVLAFASAIAAGIAVAAWM